MRRALRVIRVAALVGAAVILAACSASPGGSNKTEKSSGHVTTGVGTTKPITLTVWDYAQTDNALRTVTKRFEQKYPNVKVNLNLSKGFDSYEATLKLGLAGNGAPDVAVGNQGWTTDGELVKAHLIVPLDAYAKAYGWNKRFGNLDEFRFTQDGRHWGEGSLYGVSHWAGPYGFFVHTKMLQQLGLKIPTSLDELANAMAKAKQAGMVPMQYGALEKWPAPQELGMIMNFIADPQKLNDWVYGRKPVRFADLKAEQALTTLQDWARKGYFTPQFNGVSYDDATANFAKGQGLFMFTGTWEVPAFEGKGVEFFVLPGKVSMGGYGEGWHITAASKHKNAAAAYIDFVTNEQSAEVFAKVGTIPAAKITMPATAKPLFKQSVNAWDNLSSNGDVTKLLEWATPDMGQTIGPAIQELMAGRKTPQQVVSAVQAAYDSFHKSQQSSG